MSNMGTINFTVDATEVKLTPNGGFISVEMDMDETDINIVLNEISPNQITSHYNLSDLLEDISLSDIVDAVGEDVLIEHLKMR